MSAPTIPEPVKLFFAITATPDAPIEEAERRIEMEFGPIDHRGQPFAFDHSNYYEAEMGAGLSKRFVSCERLIAPDDLAGIKLHTNRVERLHERPDREGRRGGRTLNLDPGWLNCSRVVLATGKDFAHRIYIRDGIFEEITLIYKKDLPGYTPNPWTYSDYQDEEAMRFFSRMRELYCQARSPAK